MLSAHDSQISNLWQFLEPVNLVQDNLEGKYEDWFHVPYASHITVELHKLKNCSNSLSCYSMMFVSNGLPLQFKDMHTAMT
jgi:hypothetical protein